METKTNAKPTTQVKTEEKTTEVKAKKPRSKPITYKQVRNVEK